MSLRAERKQQSRQAILNATLSLCSQGRAFSSISLREVTREVGMVPAAFYRHFEDMSALGLELLDQVSMHLKGVLHHLGQAYLYQANTKTKTGIDLFFYAVEHHPELWLFFVSERYGGSEVLRQAIQREIHYLVEDLSTELQNMQSTQHIQSSTDLKVLAQILIDLSLNWAVAWINIQRQPDPILVEQQAYQFKAQTITQIQLLFRGIMHWQRPTSTIETNV